MQIVTRDVPVEVEKVGAISFLSEDYLFSSILFLDVVKYGAMTIRS